MFWNLVFLACSILLAYYNIYNFDPISKPQTKLPKYQRIVAVGDFHGDAQNTLKVLKLAKIVDDNNKWIAENDIFVQTGDIVDRGPDTLMLYELIQALFKQALVKGGKVIQLLGNHEVMNIMGDLRYVDPLDIKSFGGRDARLKSWSKSGPIGKYLRSLNTIEIVHNTVFLHGGLHPTVAQLGIDNINQLVRNEINKDVIPHTATVLVHPDSPMWYRGFAQDYESSACKLLAETLNLLKSERMVIGHTPQMNGKILARCNMSLSHLPHDNFEPRVYVIDVGISAAYGAVGKAALEINVPVDHNNKQIPNEKVIVRAVYANDFVNFT